MANDFKANIYSAKINEHFRNESVVGGITNSEFTEGKVKGDKITISRLNKITVKDYTIDTDIEIENAGTTESIVIMNKQKYGAVYIDNVKEAQSNFSFIDGYSKLMGEELKEVIDASVLTQIVSDANTAGNTLELTEALTRQNIVDNLLIPARTFLNVAKVPKDERYLCVDEATEPLLLASDIFTKQGTISQGYIGDAFGMKIHMSAELPANKLVAGGKSCTEFGASVSEVDMTKKEKGFGAILKALECYGSKAIKPEGVTEIDLYVAP